MKTIKTIMVCLASIMVIITCIYLISTRQKAIRDADENDKDNKVSTETVTASEDSNGSIVAISPDEISSEEEIETTEPTTESEVPGVNIDGDYPDSGITICIDPGHFKGRAVITGENNYGYDEGVFTLQLALNLQEELKHYGINSYLTRDTDSITMNGLTNWDLDGSNLALRGQYAKDADLFISIHTNANLDNANGYPTCSQPIEINKTIILVGKVTLDSPEALKVANEIGNALTKASYDKGLSWTPEFKNADANSVTTWTDDVNDALNSNGTLCYREGNDGEDYYGVLRGSSSVGVPGIIVEHGFHTVAEVRRQAVEGDLAVAWAKAEAYGIAKGYGIVQ